MVKRMSATNDVDEMARDLTDRLIRRGRVPERLRGSSETFLRAELIRVLRRVARQTSVNAGMLLAAQRVLG